MLSNKIIVKITGVCGDILIEKITSEKYLFISNN